MRILPFRLTKTYFCQNKNLVLLDAIYRLTKGQLGVAQSHEALEIEM